MPANAQVIGDVEYRAGDGPLIQIPKGPVEIDLAADSAVISWGEGNAAQVTAIPMSEYRRFVQEGVITEPKP